MIANCPSCGTHFKHEILASPARGRCGRCDSAIDLSRLRPYRIVPRVAPAAEATIPVAIDAPIGRIEAAPPAPTGFEVRPVPAPVTLPAPAPVNWDTEDPLPPIPEMAGRDPYEASVPPVTEADILESAGREAEPAPQPTVASRRGEGRGTTWALWLAAGAIAGTGTSWTLGGTTLMGISSGALAGALAGWGWLRWTSPR